MATWPNNVDMPAICRRFHSLQVSLDSKGCYQLTVTPSKSSSGKKVFLEKNASNCMRKKHGDCNLNFIEQKTWLSPANYKDNMRI